MTNHDSFDVHVRVTLRAALDEASGPHPTWADSPAREAAERHVGRIGARGRWLRLLAVAAVLAIGGGSAILVGAQHGKEPESAFAVPGPLPERLVGRWLRAAAPGSPEVWLDLGGPVLFPDPDGNGLSRQATGFVPIDADRGVLVVGATNQCPEARYLVEGVSAGQLRFAIVTDGCPGMGTLTGQAWTVHRVTMPSIPPTGAHQGSLGFTEPFHVPVMAPPDLPVALGQGAGQGRLWIGNTFWRGWFLDDQALYRDMTDPGAGALADLPGTAAELETWLRANHKLASAGPTELVVDGRTAVRFDAVEQTFAEWPPGAALDIRVDIGVADRFYLIPTGDDTIVFLVRGDTLAEEDWAEELLKTITFD